MSFTVVIPARYASTRLPGKPLEMLAGKPMLQHVYERACDSNAQRVIVATDDERIEAACQSFGGEVCMTSPHHESGTDRLEEVARTLGLGHDEVVVNVQGDEPLMPAALVNQVAERLTVQSDAAMSTLCEPIRDYDTLFNPNAVKVVRDCRGAALYFSRAPIPWARDHGPGPGANRPTGPLPDEWACFRHIGIYGYRVRLLHDFVRWSPAPLERLESLEQLRALWHGAVIAVDEACEPPQPGVDTPEDLERLRDILEASHG